MLTAVVSDDFQAIVALLDEAYLVACVGEGGEALHYAVDEHALFVAKLPQPPITTWHPGESAEETAWFLLAMECQRIIVAGTGPLFDELIAALNEIDDPASNSVIVERK